MITLFCSGCITEGPEEVLLRYLEASKKQDSFTCYDLISSEDQLYTDKDTYQKHPDMSGDEMFIVENTSFEIVSTEKQAQEVWVTVKITRPDRSRTREIYSNIPLVKDFRVRSEAERYDELNTKYKNVIPIATSETTFPMVKETDGWKLLVYAKQLKEMREKMAAEEAAAKAAKQAIIEPYKKHIEFRDVTTEVSYEYGFKAVLVFAEVKNTGTKTLSYLEVNVIGRDSTGNPIFEDKCRLVNYQDNNPKDLLKPNGTCSLFTFFPYPSSGWNQKVELEITEIGFLGK